MHRGGQAAAYRISLVYLFADKTMGVYSIIDLIRFPTAMYLTSTCKNDIRRLQFRDDPDADS